ncbi:methyltransferase domain-containing protein [Alteromonas sp. 009811495]|uniref:methyltransferase domain-containing protein n=1 Tax=Alteromonas sp. 009811495 TaxID=3002962 RepID=UPI00237E06A7|nr:methyltransferase domain-containing protein [Alteromonas sp. 009811495]WDT87452.1 methyltransferase domain-containing protein [Alteromonas sp. 009811495]
MNAEQNDIALDENANANTNVMSERAVASRFSKAATRYDSIACIQKVIAHEALNNLPQKLSGNALDIGCGTGVHTQALCERGANTTGVDIAEGMLSVARETYPDPHFVNASALSLPFELGQFTTVFSSMALQWASSPAIVAQQISKVLSQGGVAELAIMVDGSFSELKKARKIAQLVEATTPMPSTTTWVNAFQQSSLVLTRVITKDYVDSHSSIMSLLHSVKGVGAGETGKKQPPLSRRDIKKLAMAYQNISAVGSELPLTYRVSHFRLEQR